MNTATEQTRRQIVLECLDINRAKIDEEESTSELYELYKRRASMLEELWMLETMACEEVLAELRILTTSGYKREGDLEDWQIHPAVMENAKAAVTKAERRA